MNDAALPLDGAIVAHQGNLAADMMEIACILTDEQEEGLFNLSTEQLFSEPFISDDDSIFSSANSEKHGSYAQYSVVSPEKYVQCTRDWGKTTKTEKDKDQSGTLQLHEKRSRPQALEDELNAMAFVDTSSEGDANSKCSQRRKIIPLGRILKRDFRRDIPRMYANALNQCRKDQLASFFQRICTGNCSFLDIWKVSLMPEKVPVKLVDGVPNIVNWISSELALMPDFTCEFLESKIVRRQYEPGCQVIMKVRVKGTKLTDSVVCIEDKDGKQHTLPLWVFQSLHRATANITKSSTLCVTSFTLDLIGTITFYLDEAHHMYRMEADYDMLPPSLPALENKDM